MTTIKDIREKLQSTLADVDKLEQNLTFDVKAGSVNIDDDPYRFVPKVNERYWYNYDSKAVGSYINRNDDTDRYYILTGNCYRTKEQAERALDIINRIGDLRGDWLPDWGDVRQRKYHPYKSHAYKRWVVNTKGSCEAGEIYMPTEQAAQTLIDEYGDDMLLVMRRL